MSSLLKRNLKHIETTSDSWKSKLDRIDGDAEPDYQLFNEIELHREGTSPLIAVFGVENIDALKTIQGDLRRFTAVVAEPDLNKLKHLLSNRDLTDLIMDRNVLFVCGESVDELGHELERYYSVAMIDDVQSISPLSDRKHEFESAIESLREFKQSAKNNLSTFEEFLTDWYVYFAENIKQYLNSPPLTEYAGLLNGQTVTIVGPGPSLDQYTDELKQLSDGWIICLDTALPVLNNLGIEPDFVVTVDVGEENLAFLDNYPREAVMICPAYMNPKALDVADRTILCDTLFPPLEWLRQDVESTGYLALSGSVASGALDLVRKLEPSECYLMGIDLAVPDLIPYSKHSERYQSYQERLNRFQHLPNLFLNELSDRGLRHVQSPWGPLLTHDQYMNWKTSFEAFVEESEFPYLRLGEKVVPIEGVRLTKRISSFNPKTSVEFPTSVQKRIKSPDKLTERVNQLLDELESFHLELKTLKSKRKRGGSFESEWLNFIGKIGERTELIDYFQWEVDRLTNELQRASEKADHDLTQTINRQLNRWDQLINHTREGLKSLL